MSAMDDFFTAQRRLNQVKQATNDKNQIAIAQKAVDDARAKIGQERVASLAAMARKKP